MKHSPFTPAQRQTLLAIRTSLPDTRVVLVGASALACSMEMRWRKTNDLDLAFVAEERDLVAMLCGVGWIRHERHEQRWTSEQGALVDALPTATTRASQGHLVFRESGHVMSLVGFDLALAHSEPVSLDTATTLDVATVPVIALLKMAAWLDRPAERDRDLEDLAHILDDYLDPVDLRRWEDAFIAAGLAHQDQSAFALGQDIASIAGAEHLTLIEAFVKAVSDEASPNNAQFARCFGKTEGAERLAARLRAFQMGCRELE